MFEWGIIKKNLWKKDTQVNACALMSQQTPTYCVEQHIKVLSVVVQERKPSKEDKALYKGARYYFDWNHYEKNF